MVGSCIRCYRAMRATRHGNYISGFRGVAQYPQSAGRAEVFLASMPGHKASAADIVSVHVKAQYGVERKGNTEKLPVIRC